MVSSTVNAAHRHLVKGPSTTSPQTYLTDVFKATYARTTLAALTAQLGRHGFDVERRLIGGSPFDFDHDRIAADPYGVEKFGEGILRVLGRRSA